MTVKNLPQTTALMSYQTRIEQCKFLKMSLESKQKNRSSAKIRTGTGFLYKLTITATIIKSQITYNRTLVLVSHIDRH